jgi:hypothetical protein
MDDPLYFRAYDLVTVRSCLRFDSMLMSLVILVLAVVTDFANATDDPNDLGGATFYGNAQGGSGG